MSCPTGIGRIRAQLVIPGRDDLEIARATNDWTFSWAHILAMLAGPGDLRFKPSHLYLEFQNVSNPANPVTIPNIDRADGVNYYLGLASAPTTDYLRIPIITAVPARDADYAGTLDLPAGQFNQIVYEALSVGSQGANGKPFSNAANSKVFGVALAAAPAPNDPTQDIVFGRSYYSTSNQHLAPAVGSLRVTYAITGK